MLRRNTIGLKYKHNAFMEQFSPAHDSPVQCKPRAIRTQNIGASHYLSSYGDGTADGTADGVFSPGKFDAINFVGEDRYGLVKPNRIFPGGITASPLGTGQFSSVFNAIDFYTYDQERSRSRSLLTSDVPTALAMKIVDKKFKILALREIAILKYVNNLHAGSYCKNLFVQDDICCCCLYLYLSGPFVSM